MLFLLFVQFCYAFTVTQSESSFDQAAKNPNFIRFQIESKKLGLFSSSFEGYAKQFQVEAKVNGDTIQKATLVIPVKQISTDLYARDDQMWNLCFEEKKYPEIKVEISNQIVPKGQEKMVPAKVFIRGKEKEIQVRLKNSSDSSQLRFEGLTHLSFSLLEIPDPSIGVASVKDAIDVNFAFQDKP